MGGKLVKNQTGYNLVQLLVGSEGTLAVVTRIILRLLPLPPCRVDLLVPFDDFQAAAGVVSAIIARRIVPTTIEFMERDTVYACQQLLDKELPYAGAGTLISLMHLIRRSTPTARRWPSCAWRPARSTPGHRPATRDRLWRRGGDHRSAQPPSPTNHMEDLRFPPDPRPAARHPRRPGGWGAHPGFARWRW
jgi:FAD/FMN-containing dehydrogenase